MIKFSMELEHTGAWREIEPTGAIVYAVGYRCFEIEAGKIRAHWALLDGNAIENQLRQTTHGCKIQH
jgi:predicted ester cyclase